MTRRSSTLLSLIFPALILGCSKPTYKEPPHPLVPRYPSDEEVVEEAHRLIPSQKYCLPLLPKDAKEIKSLGNGWYNFKLDGETYLIGFFRTHSGIIGYSVTKK